MADYQPPYVPHDDPLSDGRNQLLQALTVLTTVGEAGARWGAVGIQKRAAKREQELQGKQAALAARREADALANWVRAERQKMADAMSGEWLKEAPFVEVARVWRTATVAAAVDGDPVARKAAALAEQRLRQLHPDLMSAYDRYRAAGKPVDDAMRRAGREVWNTYPQAARPHGTSTHYDALPPGGDEFDQAVRQEAQKLAEHVNPEALQELQRQLREQGRPPSGPVELLDQFARVAAREGHMSSAAATDLENRVSVATAEHLRTYAEKERAVSSAAAGMVDNPRTEPDEHTEGQVESVQRNGRADRHEAVAAAWRSTAGGVPPHRPAWTQAFPPLRPRSQNSGAVSTPPSQGQTQIRGRAR